MMLKKREMILIATHKTYIAFTIYLFCVMQIDAVVSQRWRHLVVGLHLRASEMLINLVNEISSKSLTNWALKEIVCVFQL